MLALALFMSFVIGMLVAVAGLWNLLVAPLRRSVDALEEKVDKLAEQRESKPASERKSWTESDPHARRTLLPQNPDDVPIFALGREPSDTLPSAAPTG